uniref:Uncharacterized protein n=1 Tax=Arundo donax TaxID=35708 RepID=A0A0A9DS83_ARUDO
MRIKHTCHTSYQPNAVKLSGTQMQRATSTYQIRHMRLRNQQQSENRTYKGHQTTKH